MNLVHRLHDPALPYARFSLRVEATHTLAAVMEAMWIAPWFAVFLPAARATPPYALLLYVTGNILAALWMVRLLDGWGLWENLRQIIFLSGLALAVLGSVGIVFPPQVQEPVQQSISAHADPISQVTLPPLLPVLLLVSLLWWRGLRVALITPSPIRVAFGVRLGILFFFGAALLPEAHEVVVTALPPFFFFGLLAVSLARALVLRQMRGQPPTFGSGWVGFMALAAAGITLVGFAVAAVLSGLDPELIARVVQPVVTAVVLVIAVLMTPIFLVLQALVEAIIAALSNLPGLENVLQAPQITEGLERGSQSQGNRLAALLQQLGDLIDRLGGIQTCATVLALLVVVLVIVFTLRRRQRAMLPDDEEREDLEGNTLDSLRQMFRRGLSALGSALSTVGQFGLGRNLFAALTVRRIYAQMAALAAKRGYPRAPSETPYEYCPTLYQAYPQMEAEIMLVTEAYVRVHYGEVPETSDALQQVVDAWERLKASPSPT